MKNIFLFILLSPYILLCQIKFETSEVKNEHFPIIQESKEATIFYESSENILIQKSANFLASDIEKVTDRKPKVVEESPENQKNIIVVT